MKSDLQRSSVALSAVVPCYNEKDVLDELLRRLTDACEAVVGEDFEIILVDDGSSDTTGALIRDFHRADARTRGLLLSRRVADALQAMPERQRFVRGMISWVGYRRTAFEYDRDIRFAGETKYPLRKMIFFALDAITSFSILLLRLATLFGFLVAGGGLLYGLWIFIAVMAGLTVPGWASTTLLLLIIGGCQLVFLGILGAYIGRIYIEAKARPLFFVDDMHKQSIKITGEDPEFFAAHKVKGMQTIWQAQHPDIPAARILDFGGGTGASAPHLRACFEAADIVIADVSTKSLEIARQRGIERLETLAFDGASLPLEDDRFDLALAACVFHHIPEDAQTSLLAEIWRVLKPGGQLIVFEHNPWNPPTVNAVNTCPFDENAVLIPAPEMRKRMTQAGFQNCRVAFQIFFPNILRGLRSLEKHMTGLPIGAQYSSMGEA